MRTYFHRVYIKNTTCKNEYLTAFDYLSAVMSSPVPKLKSIVQTFLDKELMWASKARLANKSGMHTQREFAMKHGIKKRQNIHFTDSGGMEVLAIHW